MNILSNTIRPLHRALLLASIAASVGASGCASSSSGGAESPTTAATAGGEVESCAQYAASLCEAAGPSSPTCEAARMTTAVMPASACDAGLAELDYTRTRLAKFAEACTALSNRLCDDIGHDTETCEIVREQMADFEAERCRVMQAHYEEVLAEVRRIDAMRKPLSEEQQLAISQGKVPTFGPTDASVTVVAFSDFECPYCAKAAEVTRKIRDQYPDQVRFVFRQFPLPFHSKARQAAAAALAADAQGKFWEYHDLLFAHQNRLDHADLERYAEELELDVEAFREALAADQTVAQIEADLELGEAVAVAGTPTMFINGDRVPNPTDFEAVAQQIDSVLPEDAEEKDAEGEGDEGAEEGTVSSEEGDTASEDGEEEGDAA